MGCSRHLFLGLALAVFLIGCVPESKGAPSRGLVDPHIIGGENVVIEKVPYQLSLELFRMHICGGAIVSEKFVLTAAHCVDDRMSGPLWGKRIRAGSTIQFPIFNFFGGVIHQIESVKMYPDFDPSIYDNDLAVITVSNNFVFTDRVKPISLPTEGESFINYNVPALASGWGLTSLDGWFPPLHLKWAQLPLVPREECEKRITEGIPITKRTLCAGGDQKNATFSGDSGGPLVHKGKLIGLVSWGSPTEGPNSPSGFANLLDDEMRAFIKEHTEL